MDCQPSNPRRFLSLPYCVKIFLHLLFFSCLTSLLAQPELNGRFYGDGDNSVYHFLAAGLDDRAILYYYLDSSTNDLFIACVVSEDVNDCVLGKQGDATDVAYCVSVGWGKEHWGKSLVKSDHLELKVTTCSNGAITWTIDFVEDADADENPQEADWYSSNVNPITGVKAPDGAGTAPAGTESRSSMQWNLNYGANPANTDAWHVWIPHNSNISDNWKSPYDTGFENTLQNGTSYRRGYPTYDPLTQWEWRLVYEVKIPLSTSDATCQIGIEVVSAHNSPPKTGSDDTPIKAVDFGDAPDSYCTTELVDGPRHEILINGLKLGSLIGGEADGQPTTDAKGDDINTGNDDEDGVDLPAVVNTNEVITIPISATGAGILNAWIDWNGNGIFDASEALTVGGSADIPVTAGTTNISVTVPSDAALGVIYARFRLSSAGGLMPTGYAPDGEVEDYMLTIEPPIEIGLISFDAQLVKNAIRIDWLAANEMNNAGYNLYRSTSSVGDFEKINENLIPTKTSTSTNSQYEYLDSNVKESTYFYKLEDINLDGQSSWHGPIQSTIASDVASAVDVPAEYELAGNYPNPFNPVTSINYSLPKRSDMQLVIYDVQGKRVRTLVSGEQAAGIHSVEWNGTNDSGEFVSSGIYLYRMTAGDFVKTERMTLLK